MFYLFFVTEHFETSGTGRMRRSEHDLFFIYYFLYKNVLFSYKKIDLETLLTIDSS